MFSFTITLLIQCYILAFNNLLSLPKGRVTKSVTYIGLGPQMKLKVYGVERSAFPVGQISKFFSSQGITNDMDVGDQFHNAARIMGSHRMLPNGRPYSVDLSQTVTVVRTDNVFDGTHTYTGSAITDVNAYYVSSPGYGDGENTFAFTGNGLTYVDVPAETYGGYKHRRYILHFNPYDSDATLAGAGVYKNVKVISIQADLETGGYRAQLEVRGKGVKASAFKDRRMLIIYRQVWDNAVPGSMPTYEGEQMVGFIRKRTVTSDNKQTVLKLEVCTLEAFLDQRISDQPFFSREQAQQERALAKSAGATNDPFAGFGVTFDDLALMNSLSSPAFQSATQNGTPPPQDYNAPPVPPANEFHIMTQLGVIKAAHHLLAYHVWVQFVDTSSGLVDDLVPLVYRFDMDLQWQNDPTQGLLNLEVQEGPLWKNLQEMANHGLFKVFCDSVSSMHMIQEWSAQDFAPDPYGYRTMHGVPIRLKLTPQHSDPTSLSSPWIGGMGHCFDNLEVDLAPDYLVARVHLSANGYVNVGTGIGNTTTPRDMFGNYIGEAGSRFFARDYALACEAFYPRQGLGDTQPGAYIEQSDVYAPTPQALYSMARGVYALGNAQCTVRLKTPPILGETMPGFGSGIKLFDLVKIYHKDPSGNFDWTESGNTEYFEGKLFLVEGWSTEEHDQYYFEQLALREVVLKPIEEAPITRLPRSTDYR